jgi:Protein of unknown function (DUF3176)
MSRRQSSASDGSPSPDFDSTGSALELEDNLSKQQRALEYRHAAPSVSSPFLEQPMELKSVVAIQTATLPSVEGQQRHQTRRRTTTGFNSLLQKDFFLRQWIWEIAGLCFSLGSILTILILLRFLDGTLLSAWTLSIAPNTTISILATIAKASMIYSVTQCLSQLKWHYFESPHPLKDLETFDSASRGPAGALRLIWSLRSHAYLAYLGAIVIIASIAIDPFAQELIRFQSEVTRLPDNTPLLGTSHLYDPSIPAGSMTVGMLLISRVASIRKSFQC